MPGTLFATLANVIVKRYRLILLGALGLTIVSFILITQLQIDFSLDSLLPSNDQRAQELIADLKDIGSQDVLIALVSVGGPEHLEEGKLIVNEFVNQMATFPSIRSIEARISEQQQRFMSEVFLPHAALFLNDKELKDLVHRLSDSGISDQVKENKRLMFMPMQGGAGELIVRDPLGLRVLWLSRWLSERAFGNLELVDGYLVGKDHSHLLVFVHPGESARNIHYTKALMDAAHQAASNAIKSWGQVFPAATEIPRIDFAGGYSIAFADEALTRKDMQTSIIVSFVGVSLLFYLVFRNLRVLLLVLVPLTMGVVWTFGFLRLIFGQINVITGTFGGVLLGLGTDFAIYFLNIYIAGYRVKEHSTALSQALVKSGPGILIGGTTSAAGFLTLGVSSFQGFSELGVITGLGMLLCLFAMLVVLPAFLVWHYDHGWRFQKLLPIPDFGLQHLFKIDQRYCRWMVGGSVIILVILGALGCNVLFDDDLRSLRPQEQTYQLAQRKVESLLGGTGGYLLLVTEAQSSTEALNRAYLLNEELERLKAEGSLAYYRSVLSYLPAPESQKRAIHFFAKHREELNFQRIGASFQNALQENGFQFLPEYTAYLEWLETFLQPQGELNPESFARAGLSSLIEPFLVKRNTSYKLMIYIYPPTGIWLRSDLEKLMVDLRQVVDGCQSGNRQWRLGGFPVLSHYLKQQVLRDLNKTVILASLAIVALVFVAFRHVLPATLATIPLIAALLGTLGIMALTSIPLNYVNFVVLPIMIGICINDGVLIISYWLQEPESNLTEILGKIGRAVLLTSLTTLMGFGSLVCSHYPGLRSIGLLTGLGILVELSASLLFLPALLGWMEQQATSKKVLR